MSTFTPEAESATTLAEAQAENASLREQVDQLHNRLQELEDTIWAIRGGEVNAVVVDRRDEPEIWTLEAADRLYLDLMLEAARAGTWHWELPAGPLKCSPSLLRMLGLPASGATTIEEALERVHVEDRARLRHSLSEGAAGKREFYEEFRIVSPDGPRWMAARARAVRSAAHHVQSWLVGITLDITERKCAEEKLAALAERLRLVTDAVPALISYIDNTGCYRFNNKGYEEWFGQKRGTLEGRHLREVLGEAAFEQLRPYFEAALAGQRVQYEQEIPYRRSGTRFVHAEYVPDVRPDGSVAGLYALVHDISESKRVENALRQSERELAAELEVADKLQQVSTRLIQADDIDALFAQILDAAVGIMRSDFASLQMYDPSRKEGELRLLAHRGFTPEAARHWQWVRHTSATTCSQAMLAGKRIVTCDIEASDYVAGTDDLQVFRQTGIRAAQTTPLISRSGKLLGAISTHWRTPHEPGESELRLFDVLARQAADLIERTQAEQQLKEADRRKDEFLAMLAHELRNPLAAIVSAVQLSQATGATDGDREWIRETLNRQTDQLGRLVEDLLDMARIANDRIELKLEPVALADAVSRTINSVRPMLERARHRLNVLLPKEPLWISADPARLQQVLSNLLTNAAKYTPDGGQITVRVWREADQALVAIKDNGIGLTPEMQTRAFELFAQAAQGLDRAQGGLGIGLTLVRRLVERHGGGVSVHSEGPGRGSEFTVRLPAIEPPASANHADSLDQPQTSPALKILIVDDNRDAARALSLLLKSHGHETALTYDGREALLVAASFRPNVALLDLGLPEINGFDLAVQLKQRDPDIQLAAISGYGKEEDRRRSRAAGIEVHFVKPVKLEELMAYLEQRATPKH